MSRRLYALLVVVPFAVGCSVVGAGESGETASGPGTDDAIENQESFTAAEMQEGVEIPVEGRSSTVHGATAFRPTTEEMPDSQLTALSQDEVVVIRDGLRGFDVTVVYRTGPYCGLAPRVELRESNPPAFLVRPMNPRADRSCDALMFDEAVGFDLDSRVDVADVQVEVVGFS